MKRVGYARVSTKEHQCLKTQIAALLERGCTTIFAEKESGGNRDRTEFQKCMEYLEPGDTLVFYHTNRWARDTLFTLETKEKLEKKGVKIESILDPIDLSTPDGECLLTINAAIATKERKQHSLLVKDRLARAVRNGVKLGRPLKCQGKEALEEVVQLHRKGVTIKQAMKLLEISDATYYRKLGEAHALGLYPEYVPMRARF